MTSLRVLQRRVSWLIAQRGSETCHHTPEPLIERMTSLYRRSCRDDTSISSWSRTVASSATQKDPDEVPRATTISKKKPAGHLDARGGSSTSPMTYDTGISSPNTHETLSTAPGQPSMSPRPSSSAIHVDTLSMMKQYEDLGLSRPQAEALTHVVTDVLRRNIDMLAETFVSAAALDMSELRAASSISGFRAEVMKIQELQEVTSVREIERLQANLDKVKSEIRYEVDKLTASQRLDLNLEKGRMRDELQSLRDKSNELEIKVDKEVNSLKAAMEQSKNDTVKYMLGVVMALITAGLGAARLFI